MEEPEGPAFAVDLFQELSVALTSHVLIIHKEGLEVIYVEICSWQSVEWVSNLLLLFCGLGLGCCSFGCLFRLFFGHDDGLEALLCHLYLSINGNKLRDSSHPSEPSASLWGNFLEALVQTDLKS